MTEPALVDQWVNALMLSEDEIPAFKAWWASNHSVYSGTIARQSLIDFCQQEAMKSSRQAHEFWFASEAKKIDAQAKIELLEGYSNCLAEQLAYRKVVEWAREQVERNGKLD